MLLLISALVSNLLLFQANIHYSWNYRVGVKIVMMMTMMMMMIIINIMKDKIYVMICPKGLHEHVT